MTLQAVRCRCGRWLATSATEKKKCHYCMEIIDIKAAKKKPIDHPRDMHRIIQELNSKKIEKTDAPKNPEHMSHEEFRRFKRGEKK